MTRGLRLPVQLVESTQMSKSRNQGKLQAALDPTQVRDPLNGHGGQDLYFHFKCVQLQNLH
jgi:hypothetical protein